MMTGRRHLLLGFLLNFGVTLFSWALLLLTEQFSLVIAIPGGGAGGGHTSFKIINEWYYNFGRYVV